MWGVGGVSLLDCSSLTHLLEHLRSEEDHTGGAVADLGVLAHADVDESLGSGVSNFEELHDGRAVVADGDLAAVEHELVHAAGAEGGLDGLGDGAAGVDVGDELGLALASVGSFPEEDDSGAHAILSHIHD